MRGVYRLDWEPRPRAQDGPPQLPQKHPGLGVPCSTVSVTLVGPPDHANFSRIASYQPLMVLNALKIFNLKG